MRRGGFSLLEVLVSLGLLGLILTVVIGLFLSSYSVSASSSSLTVAGQLGAGELARLKSRTYTDLKSLIGGTSAPRKLVQNGVEYELLSTVSSLKDKTGDTADTDLLQLVVTVSWKDTAALDERGLNAKERKAHVVHLESQVGLEGRY